MARAETFRVFGEPSDADAVVFAPLVLAVEVSCPRQAIMTELVWTTGDPP
jgi:hypothetical protein